MNEFVEPAASSEDVSDASDEVDSITPALSQMDTHWSPLGEKDQFMLTTNSEVRTCLDCIYHGFEIASKFHFAFTFALLTSSSQRNRTVLVVRVVTQVTTSGSATIK